MRRLVSLLAIIVLAAARISGVAAAQQRPVQPLAGGGGGGEGDQVPPIIEFFGGAYTIQTPPITIHWCDNVSLNASSRWIKVNGVDRTSAFTYTADTGCTSTKLSTSNSVTLDPGSNTIEAYICDGAGNCTTETFNISYNAQPTPSLSLAPHRGDLVDYARCASACFAATQALSTVPYFTLNTPRNVTLVYNSDAANPRPFIHVDVTHAGDQYNLPTAFYLRLRKADQTYVTFLNGETTLRFTPLAGAALRLSGQFDAIANGMSATRSYPVTVVVGADYGGTLRETSQATRVMVVNEPAGVARGWTVAGFQRIAWTESDGSVLIVEGDGSATYFQKSGGTFTSPAGDFTRLITGGPVPFAQYTRYYPDSTRVTFINGYPSEISDRFGNLTTFLGTYVNGVLVPQRISDPTETQSNLRRITFVYDANGLDYIQDAFGRITQVTVDANRNLLTFKDPDGDSTRFTYDSTGLRTATDRLGATSTLAYHILSGRNTGRVLSVTSPTVAIFGQGTISLVDSAWSWQTRSTPYAATASTAFTSVRADSVRATVWDAGGHASAFTVNALGQPLRAMGLLGDTVTANFNSAGQPTQVVDRLGVTSSFTYASGFLTQSTVAGAVMNYRNGGWGLADSIWGNGTAQRLFINNAAGGRVDSVRIGGRAGVHDTLQTVTHYQYDTRGRVLIARDNVRDSGAVTPHLLEQHWYNGPEGNLSKDSLPTSATVTYGYDGYGRPTTVTQSGLPARTVEYDAVNRVTRSWDGVNPDPTRYGYGRQLQGGLVTDTVVDPAGNIYRFTRNALGWVVAQTDPGGRSDSVQYDRDGLVRRSRNRRGQVDTLTYDALHRLTRRSGTANDSARYDYSTDGRRLYSWSAAASDTTFLSAQQRVDSVRIWLAVPGSSARLYRLTHTYTGDGRPLTTSVLGTYTGLARAYGWRANVGVLDSLKFGSTWTRFTYNPDLQATVTRFSVSDSISHRFVEPHRSAVLRSPGLNQDYSYDQRGRITVAGIPGAQWQSYAYDSLGHLSRTRFEQNQTDCTWDPQFGFQCTSGTLDSTHTFRYDPVGNRDTTVTPAGTTTGTYAAGNRIQTFAGCSYSTDSTGNVTARTSCADSSRFWWSPGGRLDSLKVGARRLRFAYDAAGRLVRRDSASYTAAFQVQSYFLWDGDNLVAELNATGSWPIAEYSYYPGGLDNLHATYVYPSGTFYAHTDAMGNVRALANSNGQVKRTYNYDEWGRLQATSGDSLPFNNADRVRWKGALWMGPDVDLYYMRNRWYEPRTGRFLSEDPIGLDGGINQYVFAGGDPINHSDPTGLDPWRCTRYGTEYTWTRTWSDGRVEQRTWVEWDYEICEDLGGVTPTGRAGGGGAPTVRRELRQRPPTNEELNRMCYLALRELAVDLVFNRLGGFVEGIGRTVGGWLQLGEASNMLTRETRRAYYGTISAERRGAAAALATEQGRQAYAEMAGGAGQTIIGAADAAHTLVSEQSTLGKVIDLAAPVPIGPGGRAMAACVLEPMNNMYR
jgi:RHS repeat-associated protein